MMAKHKTSADDGILIIAQNKKARHEFEISQSMEAGIVLRGSEVKSIRAGGVNLRESYIRFKDGELYLVGAHISPFSHSRMEAHEPTADRKLLLHRKEIDRLSGLVSQKGMTLLALKLYFKSGRCKVEVGVGKGKKLYDKRESIKDREVERHLRRATQRRQES